MQLTETASPNIHTPCTKADANLIPNRAIHIRLLQSREKTIDILLQRHGRDSLILTTLQRIGLVSMRSVQTRVDIRWHDLHHIHIFAARVLQLHAQDLGEGGDAGFGGAVGWVEGHGEVCQRGAGEEDVGLGARLRQREKVCGEGMSDENRCREVRCHFADDFRVVGRLLEEHVVALDSGVDEDGVEFGVGGEDTLDLALQFVEVGQVPL